MLTNRFMTLPEPFGTVAREMDRAFENAVSEPLAAVQPQAPVALWEDADSVFLEVEVPGLQLDDIELTVRDGRLHIAGERKASQRQGTCWYNELRYGRFERVIALSQMFQTDTIDAELRDGVLSVTLHKKPEAKPHRIAIRGETGSASARLNADDAAGTASKKA